MAELEDSKEVCLLVFKLGFDEHFDQGKLSFSGCILAFKI